MSNDVGDRNKSFDELFEEAYPTHFDPEEEDLATELDDLARWLAEISDSPLDPEVSASIEARFTWQDGDFTLEDKNGRIIIASKAKLRIMREIMGDPLAPTQCWTCRHLFWNMRKTDPSIRPLVSDPDLDPSMSGSDIHACAAFPNGIPPAIRESRFRHDRPFPGDHGLCFAPVDERGEA